MAENFASLYERLHDGNFYRQWLALLQPYLQGKKRILDLGCGNGTLLHMLQAKGHDVTGVDSSTDMLTLAREKLGPATELCESNMVYFFTENGKYDIIISTCDNLNYLASLEEIEQVFHCVHKMLQPGGFFLFDVHSDYMFRERFVNWSYGDATRDLSVIWNIQVIDGHRYEHCLTFFLLNGKRLYQRYDNIQVEYFHPEEKLLSVLKQQQFVELRQFSDFAKKYDPRGQRTFFIAQKINTNKRSNQ